MENDDPIRRRRRPKVEYPRNSLRILVLKALYRKPPLRVSEIQKEIAKRSDGYFQVARSSLYEELRDLVPSYVDCNSQKSAAGVLRYWMTERGEQEMVSLSKYWKKVTRGMSDSLTEKGARGGREQPEGETTECKD